MVRLGTRPFPWSDQFCELCVPQQVPTTEMPVSVLCSRKNGIKRIVFKQKWY